VYGEGPSAVRALDGVSLAFELRQFAAVMGPSGSGTSTLLHLLGGLDSPTEGRVSVGGTTLTGLPDADVTRLRAKRIGFVFQFFNLLPTLTAEENALLPLMLSGADLDSGRERVRSLLERMALADRAHHRPDELSGGEQQRVALVRALAGEPDVVLADEPTGNLDTGSSREVLQLLRAAVDELGHTVVMVTHDPVAASYADRVVFLRDGRVVEDAGRLTRDDVIEQMRLLELS
jgi:putative ABC transport system ATP-binding protein